MSEEKRYCRECRRGLTLASAYKNKGLCICCFKVVYPEEYKRRALIGRQVDAIRRYRKKMQEKASELTLGENRNKPFNKDVVFKDAVNEFFICGKWKKK